MGPPKFNSQIRQYGSRTSILRNPPGPKVPAIIDGPSLAHAVYEELRYNYGDDLLIRCNLQALGRATITWLDNLQSFGFEIEGVFFDSALPSYKRKERLRRMQIRVECIINYKHLLNESAKRTNQAKKAKFALPPHPFLVPAVVEALFASSYAQKTWIVDGEADGYCAAAAAQAASSLPDIGSIIFTNDSDLIIFEFQAPVKIALIDQMKDREDVQGEKIEIYEHSPNSLTIGGKRPRLVLCAYLMETHDVSLTEAVRQDDLDVLDQGQYQTYCDRYDTKLWDAKLQVLQKTRQDGRDQLRLDARIFEPIHQAQDLFLKMESTEFAASASEHIEMYLPILLDNPARADAWKIGISFRRAAQMLILLASPSAALLEHRRSGALIRPSTVEKGSIEVVNQQLEALSWQLHALTTSASLLNPHETQRFLVMQMAVQQMAEQGMPMPTSDEIRAILGGKFHTTWNLVHLSAQFHAQYYSCRILQQVWLWWNGEQRQDQVSWPAEVLEVLRDLPSVIEFFGNYEKATFDMPSEQWQPTIGALLQRLTVHNLPAEPMRPELRDEMDTDDDPSMANNPFAKLMCHDMWRGGE